MMSDVHCYILCLFFNFFKNGFQGRLNVCNCCVNPFLLLNRNVFVLGFEMDYGIMYVCQKI